MSCQMVEPVLNGGVPVAGPRLPSADMSATAAEEE